MQTNLPTVARISETVVWLVASNPTRARDPRTEITRPKDVTVLEPGIRDGVGASLWRPSLDKGLSRRKAWSVQLPRFQAYLIPVSPRLAKKSGKTEDLHRAGRRRLNSPFTLPKRRRDSLETPSIPSREIAGAAAVQPGSIYLQSTSDRNHD